MAKKYLGETIDIHAGGEDLIFPHHENEIAQSEAANSKPFAKYWAHVRFVNVDNKKMGKSEGNFFTVRDITKKYPYAVMRFFILSGHYRTPINFSAELMEAAQNSYNRVKNCVKSLSYFLAENEDKPLSPLEAENIKAAEDFKQNFEKAMDDDFNTADAIAAVFDYVRFANSTSSADSSKEYVKLMRDGILFLCGILGIEIEKEEEVTDAEIEALIEQRQAARKAKDFKTADEIRNKLLEMGIVLEDTRQGVRYAKK
jgi:cysteinyl-tRNA synthetase